MCEGKGECTYERDVGACQKIRIEPPRGWPVRVQFRLYLTSKGGPSRENSWHLMNLLLGFPCKMTCYYPDLVELLIGWKFASFNLMQIWVVTHHQYGIFVLLPQLSFPSETSSPQKQLFLLALHCWGVLCRETSVSQQQKFYTDDIKSARNPVRRADRETV